MSIKDGGPAYPVPDLHMPDGQIQFGSYGMSLRDHFAGLAMAGMLAREYLKPTEAADDAYKYADAMLSAREQRT